MQLTDEEKKIWDQYYAAAITAEATIAGTLGMAKVAGSTIGSTSFQRPQADAIAHNAAALADAMIEERRVRFNPPY